VVVYFVVLMPHPTLSKGEGFKKSMKSKVISFGEDLVEAKTIK
jgi:hypothetical protein